MKIPQLIAGEKVYIQDNDDNNSLSEFKFMSQVEDILSEDTIIISTPFYKNTILSFFVGQRINISFIHEDGLYVWSCEILEHILDNNLLLYKILIVSEITRVQRREFFRIPLNTICVFSYKENNTEIYNKGITKDLSGGGLKFVCENEIPVNEIINIYIRLSESDELNANAEVIRCSYIKPKMYEISIKFINIDFKKRETIIKNIFKMQRENLRKTKKN